MTGKVRLFVAIELPDHVKTALAGLVEFLNSSQVKGLRTVRPESIHLTLKFLGEVDAGQADGIREALAAAAQSCPPFAVELGTAGVFPGRSNPKVLWVGIGGDLASMRRLYEQIEEALQRLGHARERRRFSPHLTVARIREGTPTAERQRAVEVLYSAGLEPGAHIEVKAVSLMRSILQPAGATYQRIATALLTGCETSQ